MDVGAVGAIGLFQMYFVRELLAAFALFAVVFAVIATFAVGIMLLRRVGNWRWPALRRAIIRQCIWRGAA